MQNKLSPTDAPLGLGQSFSRNLFRVPAGAHSGRLAAIVHTSLSDITLFYSDPPYRSWSGPTTITGDNLDSLAGCFMDADGNIFVAYAASSGSLMVRKLAYTDGSWTVGAAVTVYEGATCGRPSITGQTDGKLWVSYSRYQAPYRDIHVKSSVDGGATWGTGTTDPGEQISSLETQTYSLLVTGTNDIYLIYPAGTEKLCFRSIGFGGASWSDEEVIVAFSPGYGGEFDAAMAPDGRLAVVVSSDALTYREYDGSNWGAVQVLHGSITMTPQVYFRRNIPVVVYQTPWAGGKGALMYTDRATGSFSQPAALDGRAGHYDAVFLYNSSSASYEDVTVAAQNITSADLFHSSSGCLLKKAGDAIYVGMEQRFRFLECNLSTPGSGGTLIYSYRDGAEWKAFTPAGGTSLLDTQANDIILWEDYESVPVDWQKRAVNGTSLFWVKVEVTSPFNTGPVGNYVSAFSTISALSFRR